MNDPIVDEVRAIRAEIAQECGFDLARIADHARKSAEKIPGLRYVTAEELQAAQAYSQSGVGKRQAAVDLAWALMNSTEFLYRH